MSRSEHEPMHAGEHGTNECRFATPSGTADVASTRYRGIARSGGCPATVPGGSRRSLRLSPKERFRQIATRKPTLRYRPALAYGTPVKKLDSKFVKMPKPGCGGASSSTLLRAAYADQSAPRQRKR